MLDKKRVNPERSKFIEELIQDISTIDGYEKHGITRENTAVIVTYIIHRMNEIKGNGGGEAIDKILDYQFNERKDQKAGVWGGEENPQDVEEIV